MKFETLELLIGEKRYSYIKILLPLNYYLWHEKSDEFLGLKDRKIFNEFMNDTVFYALERVVTLNGDEEKFFYLNNTEWDSCPGYYYKFSNIKKALENPHYKLIMITWLLVEYLLLDKEHKLRKVDGKGINDYIRELNSALSLNLDLY